MGRKCWAGVDFSQRTRNGEHRPVRGVVGEKCGGGAGSRVQATTDVHKIWISAQHPGTETSYEARLVQCVRLGVLGTGHAM